VAKKKPTDFAEDRPIYDRQPDEPDRAWFAFRTYRDMTGGRAHKPVADAYRKEYNLKGNTKTTVEYMSRLARQWRWRERCAEWDRTIDERIRNRKLAAMADMEARHLELAHEASSTALLGLKQIKKMAEDAVEAGQPSLSVTSVLELAKFGIGAERTVQDKPTVIEEQRHTVDVNDKRKAMQRLAQNPDLMQQIEKELDDDK
jgi:hypothetical protein